jgi:hypothetical protein
MDETEFTGARRLNPAAPGSALSMPDSVWRLAAGIFVQDGQYCTDRRCDFGSTVAAM